MVKQRSIVKAIILSFLTCGIYGIIWFINITDEMAILSGDNNMSGGKAFLFTLLTCGIYSFIWSYNQGRLVAQARAKKGLDAKDNSILYLVLSLCGLGIVVYCLIQNEINELAN